MKKISIATFAGILLGAIAGWLYWKWIGCSNGTCRITSDPVNSTLYGAITGGLLLNIISSIFFKPKMKIEYHDKND